MRIAVSTDDGKTICGHLGRCTRFLVYEAEGGDILSVEKREGAAGLAPVYGHAVPGSDADFFRDCSAVITKSLGQGMYDGLVDAGIMPVITSESDPDSAVRQFLSGGMTGALQGNSSCGGH